MAHVNRASAYGKKGQYDQAIADLSSAISIESTCGLCYYDR